MSAITKIRPPVIIPFMEIDEKFIKKTLVTKIQQEILISIPGTIEEIITE
jgi:hypothetical protein